MASLYTIRRRVISNLFVPFAWYGQLHFKKIGGLPGLRLGA